MPRNSRKTKQYQKARQKRIERTIVIVFVLMFVMCAFAVMGAKSSLPNRSVDLSDFVKVDFTGYDGDGIATVSLNDEALDAFFAGLKTEHDNAWIHSDPIDDADYVTFRQSLSYTTPNGTGISNGDEVSVVGSCDKELAEKLKIKIKATTGKFTAQGLKEMKKIPLDDVFKDLDVSFSGVSPAVSVALSNESTQPLVRQMIFEIVDAKELYSEGDVITIHASYTDEMAEETGCIVDKPSDQCIKDYTVTADSAYISDASQLPSDVISEAIEMGKSAFVDANEYGVRIFCEANLVPVYVGGHATFTYGYPQYVSAYFKTVFPEKAGDIGLSYNDLDILYNVNITQADGTTCPACAAVRFSDIMINSDGSLTYDFSNPKILSMSYYSARVKKNVVDSYANSYDIERVD